MRPGRNPLDLNNLPDEYSHRYREGQQMLGESSSATKESSVCNKKRNGRPEKEDCGKTYECRFCSLKFCKSQALGGHMNRHRQERETETLNRARQLVYSNDSLARQGPHRGCNISQFPPGNFEGGMGGPSLPIQSIYSRVHSSSSSSILSPQPPFQPYPYPFSSCHLSNPPAYPPPPPPLNKYFAGHTFNSNQGLNSNYAMESNYTCIGATVGVQSTRMTPAGEGAVCTRSTEATNWNSNNQGNQGVEPC